MRGCTGPVQAFHHSDFLQQLRELVEAHRELFEAKWYEYFGD
jgi:hypothetical protein